MTVLDWLTNPWEPYKRGIMIGFDSSMDYAWIYRSILESVALTLKNNYDNMCNEMNHFAKHVIITGGGSNSDLFMQFLPTCSTFRQWLLLRFVSENCLKLHTTFSDTQLT